VIDKTDPAFWLAFARLPPDVQDAARHKHRLWLENPFHPSLHFKELAPGLWSARINKQYRALGRRRADLVVWFWIGTHAEYDRLIHG
jgi:hypothetical protein